MPRIARVAPGGLIFHVLNRGVGRRRLFLTDADFAGFERMLAQTLETRPMRILAYCLMPNHWHLLLWPRREGDLAAFMQKLTITHARNWQEHRRRVGTGPVYQSRFKSFPVQADEHLFQVARYVESNARRAGLVRRAEQWRWCSLWRRRRLRSDDNSVSVLPARGAGKSATTILARWLTNRAATCACVAEMTRTPQSQQ